MIIKIDKSVKNFQKFDNEKLNPKQKNWIEFAYFKYVFFFLRS